MALPLPEPRRSIRQRFVEAIYAKGALNRLARKALEAADIVLGSTPGAEVGKELKEVAEFAIRKD